MAHFKRAFPSRYMQVADLDTGPLTVTIAEVRNENVGGENEPLKLVITFREPGTKALVLNLTRAEAVAEIAASEDTDQWPGTVLQLVKGSTRYQAKKVGCIVVQAPVGALSEVGF